ncbi:DUF5723 family protein [Fodinibius sp.]|uniref:DUF5723 family protein n=1 Tax=Fodinibius sp. TaxID=1872440 RepID=UPI002ACEA415|nr:DUF5723 family protein [Fodinibius sp.]MDZ7660585.1 DUF5723 family protein [Fodinibius sp.]
MNNTLFDGLNLRSTAQLAVGILLFILSSISIPMQAQPVLNAQNTALGGGGTAYLSGNEALFWNPANLAINDRHGTIHINLGETGIVYEPVLSSDVAGDQFFNFTDSYFPYQSGVVAITPKQRQTIIDENYPRKKLVSQHQTRTDVMLGGISWYRGDETFSIAARGRYASRIEVGRGWYSDEYVRRGDQKLRDFTLDQHISKNLEIALGYGREFTFLEGLFARLSKLYVGISPKFIIAGPTFSATHYGQQQRTDENAQTQYVTEFSYQSSGEYTRMTRDYLSSGNPQTAINNNLNKKFNFEPTGYGAAFDFGLTYLIPLGSNLNIIENDPEKSVVGKSLRIAISFNDIGMIRYTEQPLSFSAPDDTLQIGREFPKESMFIGSGGQYITYFDEALEVTNPFNRAQNPREGTFSAPTPTSLNGGIMLDLERIKIMGDLTLGLNNTALTNTKLAMHLGMEVRPIKKIPLRMGTRLSAGLPAHVGIGTGYESRYWDFNIGTQIIFRSNTFTTEFVGGAFAGIQLHL